MPSFSIHRRTLLKSAIVLLAAPWSSPGQAASRERLVSLAERLEKTLDARLGIAVVGLRGGEPIGYRQDERFPLCSTFKVLAASALLKRVDEGRESLERSVAITREALVSYSPVTQQHVGEPMRLAELAMAALTQSDNTAGNQLLAAIDGPSGLTTFARQLGDPYTRLDRWETALNEATPGDPRDTTTPRAMTANLQRLLLGDALSARSRQSLIDWMRANRTGDAKLRAGLPDTWQVADKTGGGDHGSMSDIAVLWPPEGAPVIVSVYMTETAASFDQRNRAIAEIARWIASESSF